MKDSDLPRDSNAELDDVKRRLKILQDRLDGAGGATREIDRLEKKIENLITRTMSRIDEAMERISYLESGQESMVLAMEDLDTGPDDEHGPQP
jgi:predicted  nucleic acid-binding Zn-ribbon protein